MLDETVTKAALKEKILVSRIDGNNEVTVASLTRNILNNVSLLSCLNFWHTCSHKVKRSSLLS